MSRRIKKKISKDISSKVTGIDKIHLSIMRSLNSTKSIFQKLKINREKKEKEFLFSERPKTEIEQEVKKLTDKLRNSENLFDKIERMFTTQTEVFTERMNKFQELMRSMMITKDEAHKFEPSPITGEMSVEDIEHFLSTLYENYDIMNEQYVKTKDESYLEMAMDTQLAIQEINEIKDYLMERGRYEKQE